MSLVNDALHRAREQARKCPPVSMSMPSPAAQPRVNRRTAPLFAVLAIVGVGAAVVLAVVAMSTDMIGPKKTLAAERLPAVSPVVEMGEPTSPLKMLAPVPAVTLPTPARSVAAAPVAVPTPVSKPIVTAPVIKSAPVEPAPRVESAPIVTEASAPASPDIAVPQTKLYQVQTGDTLSSIAGRFYGSKDRWRELFELNRDRLDDPDHLSVRTTLRVPAQVPAAQ